jgi:hypothetical protein
MATLADQLDEARAAYHALQTGNKPVQFRDSNGELVIYAPANIAKLASYIRDLEQQIAQSRPVLSIKFNTSKGL